jgi:hypothetical protein
MRRSLWLAGSLVVSLGCGDSFNAHPDVAAEAAGQTLSAERVAEILTSVKGVTVNPEAANFVSNLWVDYTLFAQAVADNSLETDSATVHDAMWRDIAEFTAGHWFDTLIARRAMPTPEKVDSVYGLDSVRVVQHVLISVESNATEAQRTAARRKIDNALARVRAGNDFGTVAIEMSDEPAAQADSGFLPASPRGAYVAPFDSAAWLLAPGEVSGVVVTSFGFHVIRRAQEDQAKQRLERYVTGALVNPMHEAYYAELDSMYDLEVAGNAVGLVREALNDLSKAGKSRKKLVNFNDGAVTVGDFAKWIQAEIANPVEGPQQLESMKQLPDSTLRLGVTQLAQRFLFLREAERANVTVTPEEWTQIQEAFAAQVDTLKLSIGLGPDVIDPNASEADRRRAAAIRVDTFFDRMTTGESRLRLLPGMLTWTLRSRMESRVNPAGVQHAVALAEVRVGNDSGAQGGMDLPPAIAPAPGGPPVSGGDQP